MSFLFAINFKPVLLARKFAAVLFAAVWPLVSQTVRVDVNLVQIEATVTNSRGQADPDLKASDFEVLADGKPQVISRCAWVRRIDSGFAAGGGGASPAPGAQADVARSTVIVIDDLGLAAETVPLVRDAVVKYAKARNDPGNLTALVRTSSAAAIPVFSNDPRMLAAAAATIAFKTTGRNTVSSIPALSGTRGVFSDVQPQGRQAISTLQSLNSLRNAVRALAEMPGRRSLVLFSEDLQVLFGSNQTDLRVLEAERHLIDEANRASVAIDSIDPRGNLVDSSSGADGFVRTPTHAMAELQEHRAGETDRSRDALAILSRDTGGVFVRNTNDLFGALNRVAGDASGYYLIAFAAGPEIVSGGDGKPRYHELRVRVKRAGDTVHARGGFYDAPESQPEADPLSRSLISFYSGGELRVDLLGLYSEDPGGHAVVTSVVRVDTGTQVRVREVLLSADGEAVESAEATVSPGQAYAIRQAVRRPGVYQIRVAAEDAGSRQIGSARRMIEVPNVAGGEFALSSILLQGDDAAESRVYRPGASIGYGCLIFNARGELVTQTRILRDGQEVYKSRPEPLSLGGQADLKRIAGKWNLRLGSNLEPGTYTLEVSVSGHGRTAAGRADFVVR